MKSSSAATARTAVLVSGSEQCNCFISCDKFQKVITQNATKSTWRCPLSFASRRHSNIWRHPEVDSFCINTTPSVFPGYRWCLSKFAKIRSWTWSTVSRADTVEGLPAASSVSKSPHWKLPTTSLRLNILRACYLMFAAHTRGFVFDVSFCRDRPSCRPEVPRLKIQHLSLTWFCQWFEEKKKQYEN